MAMDDVMMDRRHAALREYRARSLAERPFPGLTATAVATCADACSTAALFAALEPTFMFQFPRAKEAQHAQRLVEALRGAVVSGSVRALVVCGHVDCQLSLECTEERVEAGRRSLLVQCAALYEDASLGPLLRSGRVSLQPLLFDEDAGDVFSLHPVSRALVLMSDPEVLAALAR